VFHTNQPTILEKVDDVVIGRNTKVDVECSSIVLSEHFILRTLINRNAILRVVNSPKKPLSSGERRNAVLEQRRTSQ
jgi:hypothetical protein